MSYQCPACGYPDLQEPPRREGAGGSYEICPSCGFEFGVTDEDEGYTYAMWRTKWVAAGMPWRSDEWEPRPDGWDPGAQVNRLLGSSN